MNVDFPKSIAQKFEHLRDIYEEKVLKAALQQPEISLVYTKEVPRNV